MSTGFVAAIGTIVTILAIGVAVIAGVVLVAIGVSSGISIMFGLVRPMAGGIVARGLVTRVANGPCTGSGTIPEVVRVGVGIGDGIVRCTIGVVVIDLVISGDTGAVVGSVARSAAWTYSVTIFGGRRTSPTSGWADN